ncbi:hypothetical protein VPHK479_0095 [Vibrio phage K479]
MLVQLHFVLYEDGTDLLLINEHDHHVWTSLVEDSIPRAVKRLTGTDDDTIHQDPEELFYSTANNGSSITQEEQVVFAGTFDIHELENYVKTLKLIGLTELSHNFTRTHYNYVPTEKQP